MPKLSLSSAEENVLMFLPYMDIVVILQDNGVLTYALFPLDRIKSKIIMGCTVFSLNIGTPHYHICPTIVNESID